MLVGDCCIYFLSAIFLALSVPDEPGENVNCLVTLKFKMLGALKIGSSVPVF